MEISFTCPHCGEVTLIGQEFVGQSGKCRACGRKVSVPPLSAGGLPASECTPTSHSIGSYLAYGFLAFAVGITGMCLLPLDQPRGASRRMQSGNNLKQIALAMQNYHDFYKHFPRAYYLNSNGERILSWRVAILPFIEQQELTGRYKAGEPWDSAANLEISKARVSTYLEPGNADTKIREAGYMVITGPGTLFEEGKDISIADVTDGAENTILAVEVKDSGVNWAEPVDLDIRNMIFKINGGGLGISSPWKGGANVAFADGSVRFLGNDTLESTLKAMITRAGREAVRAPR